MKGHAVLIPDERGGKKSNNMYLLPLFPLENGIGGRLLSYSGVCSQIKRVVGKE